MNIHECYEALAKDDDASLKARTLLGQAHWFAVKAEFDPKTGDALPQALSAFLGKTADSTATRLHDRLWRITEHARPSVERLFRALNESPRREHALLPVHAVRELDANSFIKLSNRPGRNIREKLAGKPYLQAVRRFQSVNLPENRLLKAFATRLEELLKLRQDCLGEAEDELLPMIQSWLFSEEAQTITRWDNLPPNNTLLSHRDYRCVWDAWRWLQTLDDDIDYDFSQLEARAETMRRWNEYGKMYLNGTYLFAEIPVLFDYEKFEIRPWVPKLIFQKTARKPPRSSKREPEIFEPVCVDLTVLHPSYVGGAAKYPAVLSDAYLWQQWKNSEESLHLELFNSDAVYFHPDTTTISLADLFFSKDNTLEHLDYAGRAFASRLREIFKNNTLTWLVPDFLNDFELEITRRNLNARFPNAEPLPRSVAAVFEWVDYSKIKNDGFSITVTDRVGGKTCDTKLIARFDSELKKRLPETCGFYWERCPSIVVSHESTGEKHIYEIAAVDGNCQWHSEVQSQELPFIPRNDKRPDPCASHIDLRESPVAGGARLHDLQQRAGDIPLWRDRIPELAIKVKIDGILRRHCLVGKNTTVRPKRNEIVSIPISDSFTLPPKRPFYQFPLYQGENADELGFSARLDSPAFPLKTATECRLHLTFEYGADEPYKLIFSPLDESFPPVRATWQRTGEEIITDAPAPEYPVPLSWDDLQKMPKPDSQETNDFLEWVISAINRLDRDLFIRPQKRMIGEINRPWQRDKKGDYFTHADCDEIGTFVFIHENNFVEGVSYEDFDCGNKVSFELQKQDGKTPFGRKIAYLDYEEELRLRDLDDDLIKNIRKRLYVPFIQVWKDGRSITDEECPEYFAQAAPQVVEYLTDLLSWDEIPQQVKNEFLFLLACIHKDTTGDCVQWISEQVEKGCICDSQAVGFGLGDLSEEWQQNIFSSLASSPDPLVISSFAYAIWREEHFVEKFSISELQMTLKALSKRLADISSAKLKDADWKKVRNWARSTAESLELLLGLLRTRASANPEIKMCLQPHQEIAKKLAKQVERIVEIVVQSNVKLFSRVQLNLQKPEGDRTPDLLYALRLYLTGDDGANAIHITSVSDNDNDNDND